MRKRLSGLGVAVFLLLASPVFTITGGQPDGQSHPYGALVLVPGYSFCSGTLIDEDVVLTAGHCTEFFGSEEVSKLSDVWVTFDTEAAVDPKTWERTNGTWYRARAVATHPDYVDADWPFTADYGLVLLEEAVGGITPASLPSSNLLADYLGRGQTSLRFMDVGYGQDGVTFDRKPYVRNFDFIRKYSLQRYNPSVGAIGTLDPMWLMLQNSPSSNHGGACGGDSGSGVFGESGGALGDTVVAVHTGGYHLGYRNRLCGRMTSLNHRVDLPVVLDWIAGYLD